MKAVRKVLTRSFKKPATHKDTRLPASTSAIESLSLLIADGARVQAHATTDTATGSTESPTPATGQPLPDPTTTGLGETPTQDTNSVDTPPGENLPADGSFLKSFRANGTAAEDEDQHFDIRTADSELNSAVAEFRDHYQRFRSRNQQLISADDNIHSAIDNAVKVQDIKHSAHLFGAEISTTLTITKKKQELSGSKWLNKLGNFITKLYPVARLSLSLTSAIAEVSRNDVLSNTQGTKLSPLKGVADGLGIILQVTRWRQCSDWQILEEESDRASDFYEQLRRIEFQSARIANNPNFDLNLEATRDLMKEKSIDLMTGIANLTENLLKRIGDGEKVYENGKRQLEITIKEYDQAVLDLTAMVVATAQFEQAIALREEQDQKFLKWLSPSYWLVEGQLSSVRKQRGKDTLEWARNMEEFRAWRNSKLDVDSSQRILWVRGTLGVGKTIMAGYFIELLKCLYPESIVAYFFCRSGQAGLIKARDIIRTLVYYCAQNDPDARTRLESLREQNFPINDDVGVGFLFDKLLRDIIDRGKKEVFIVLDGLDEADRTSQDSTERPPRPEIEILLQHLAALSSTRLLIISRGEADVSRIIPNSITKSLVKGDNTKDIDEYVRQTVDGSTRLKMHFQNEGIDPFKYFHDKANGIFLWVVIVLHQLAQTKSSSTFRKFLDGFSKASGDMDTLYSKVSERIEEEDRKWVQWILKWVIVNDETIEVEQLREAVEWSLQDKLPEFQHFLEVECGSLVHVIPSTSSVELIHDTLRSFLLEPGKAKEFHVDERSTRGCILEICVNILSSEVASTKLCSYVSALLSKLFRRKRIDSPSFLISMYHFFEGGGCKKWIEYSCLPTNNRFEQQIERWGFEIRTSFFYEYIKEELELVELETKQAEAECDKNIVEAFRWKAEIRVAPWKLSEYLGKAAAELWLYEALPLQEACSAFDVALLFYCRSHHMEMYDVASVQSLGINDFLAFSTWVGNMSRAVKQANLGVAAFRLRLWKDAIRYFENSVIPEADRYQMTAWLSKAYMEIGDWDNAIVAFEKFGRADESVDWVRGDWKCLALAYQAKRDFAKAKSTLQSRPKDNWAVLVLAEKYRSEGNIEAEISLYQQAITLKSGSWWVWYYLAAAYIAKGDVDGATEVHSEALKCHPTQNWTLESLLYESLGQQSIAEKSNDSATSTKNVVGVAADWRTSEMIHIHDICTSLRAAEYEDWQVATRRNAPSHLDIRLLWTFDTPAEMWMVTFSPDGLYLAAGGYRYVHFFEAKTGARIFSLVEEGENEQISHVVPSISFSPDGRSIATGVSDSYISIWNVEDRTLIKRLKTSSPIASLVFSNDGKLLLSGSADNKIWLWDVSLEIPILKLSLPESTDPRSIITSVAISSCGKFVAAVKTNDNRVHIWETATGTLVESLTGHVGVGHASLAFPPCRESWLNGLRESPTDVQRYIESRNQMDSIVPDDVCEIGGRQWSPDGHYLFYGDWDGSFHVWSADGVRQATVVDAHIISIAHTPVIGAQLFATTSWDGRVRLWRYHMC